MPSTSPQPKYLKLEEHAPREWAFNHPREWEFFDAKMLRAGDAQRVDDFARAREIFVEIIELCPDYLPAYNDLGCQVHKEGDDDWAIAMWDDAVNLGLACIPEEFIWEQDIIPWHFEDNRPFLLALENLGQAYLQKALFRFKDYVKLSPGYRGISDLVAAIEPFGWLLDESK